MRQLRTTVFWPTFLLLLMAGIMSMVNQTALIQDATRIHRWILSQFGWLFSLGGVTFLGVCVWVYFSPLGTLRIGGRNATPLLSKWEWFSVTLCTTIAIGILFWATAEPLYHLLYPPQGLALEPATGKAARFALSTMFMHWSVIPYAIYTLPAVLFAFAYYNMKQPFSLHSTLKPLMGLGVKSRSRWGLGIGLGSGMGSELDSRVGSGRETGLASFIDSLCLFALVAGMAASLGTGILTLAGGLNHLWGVPSSVGVWALIGIAVVLSFCLSSISGIQRGIRVLSNFNAAILVGLMVFVFVLGPTVYMLGLGVESLGEFLDQFFSRSLMTGTVQGDLWPQQWTLFYWANWLAWAPITALFLGRISLGYTVRQMLMVNLVLPSVFAILWMGVFSGTTLHMELVQHLGLGALLQEKGPEAVIYAFLSRFPLAGLVIPFFLFTCFLSYVTAADSNTTAMGALSVKHISVERPEAGFGIKFLWGAMVGLIAWVMIGFAGGIEGVKMLSILGGFPVLLLLWVMVPALVRVGRNPHKYNWVDSRLMRADRVFPDSPPTEGSLDPLQAETETPPSSWN